MNRLMLKLLGPFESWLGEQSLGEFRTAKVQALLIYLVVEAPTIHPRESLMELMWPGLPLPSAQVNLRQIIYQLRKMFPGDGKAGKAKGISSILISDRQTVQLNPAFLASCDVAAFINLLQRCRRHDHSDLLGCHACRGWLEEAIGLYRGEFLSDFLLYDSNAFEVWSQAKREGLRRQMLDGLDTLTLIHLEEGEFREAEKLARRQLEMDEYRESATRQLMRVLAKTGRRSEALEAYESCRRRLIDDLGMAPAVKTTALCEQIRTGELTLAVTRPAGIRGYDLKEKLGEGAFGSVYRAFHKGVGREVAVKVIRPELANQPQFIQRFEAEARIVSRLEHPYIVPLYDYWREPDGAYLVMRWMRGGNLGDALAEKRMDVERAVTLLEQVAAALHRAHRQGIIHRDIKPSNILLDEEGNGYLSDFGIAKDAASELHLTRADELLGSPAYVSPEVLLGEVVTPATDVYSLGLVLYETLTGSRPFSDTSLAELVHRQLNEPLPLVCPQRPDLPEAVEEVIQRATAKQTGARFDDPLALARAFREAVTLGGTSLPVPAVRLVPDEEIVNPYKGLRPFEEMDAERFFGRQRMVQRVLARMAEGLDGSASLEAERASGRFLAIVGPSGSGKSSVVKAGVIPALRKGALAGSEDWFITEMVPGSHPLEELEAALLRVAVSPPASLLEPMQRDERGLIRVLRRILPQEVQQEEASQLLLLVDQFEELFTLVEEEKDRSHFINLLLTTLAEPASRLWLVVTLRADFYDRPLQYGRLGELLRQRTELVLPLTQAELEEAITRPAAEAGVACDEALATAIVADVIEQPGALPLTQYALTELFERRVGRRMTLNAYQELGGAMGVLGQRAEEIFGRLSEAGKEAARQLFLRLVTLGEGVEDTRRRVQRSEVEMLDPEGGKAPDAVATLRAEPFQTTSLRRVTQMDEVINAFGRYRLLTFDRDPATRGPTLEVAHEALLREWERLRDWLNESRTDMRLQRQLARAADEWDKAGRDGSFLIPGGARLSQFESWRQSTELALTPLELTYLETSLAAEEGRQAYQGQQARTQRNLQRALMGALAIGLLLAIGLSIFAFSRQRAAEASEQEALRQASIGLAAQALAELDGGEPERAVLLALAALNEYPYTSQAESALAQAVYGTHQQTALQDVGNIVESMEFSVDGSLVAGGEWNVVIWDSVTGEVVNEIDTGISTPNTITGLDWLSDNSALLTARQDLGGIVNVWEVATGQERLRYEAHEGPVNKVYVGPDDRLALSAGADGTAHIWLIENGQTVQILAGHEGAVTDAIWSPNGRQVATAAGDGAIRLWDIQTGAELLRTEAHVGGVTALSWASDGVRLASSGNDGLGRVWDASTGELLFTLIGHDALVRDIEWAPDDSLLATAGGDGLVRVWETASGIEQFALVTAFGEVADVSWSPDGRRLVVSGLPEIWDVSTPVVRLTGYETGEDAVISTNWPYWSPDSSWVGAGGLGDGTYRLWRAATGEQFKLFEGVTGGFGAPNPDGTEIFLVNPGRLVNLETSATRPVSTPEEIGDLYAIQWSGDGSLFTLQGSPAREYPVYDADTLDLLFMGKRRECGFLWPSWFSPDNRLLAQTCAFSDITTVRLTEALTGEVVRELEGHTDFTIAASWSPDGSKLATTSADLTARVWDVATGETLTVMTGHTELPVDLDWSPNGNRLVSGDAAGNVLVWDAETGGVVNRYSVGGYTFGNRWSPDGTRVLTTGTFDAPEIRPVWQSTAELIDYASECCVFRQLTPEERRQFGLPSANEARASGVP